MKYLVCHYDYDDVEHSVVNIPEYLADKVFKLLDLSVIASGEFESGEKELDIKKELKSLQWQEKTQLQAEKEWESSKKTKEHYDKLAVSFSGSIMPIDYLTKEAYLIYVAKETADAVEHNKEVKSLLEELS